MHDNQKIIHANICTMPGLQTTNEIHFFFYVFQHNTYLLNRIVVNQQTLCKTITKLKKKA